MTHPLFTQASALTGNVIGAAIEVHKHFGPGLIESVYEWALIRELSLSGHRCTSQQCVEIAYKGVSRREDLKYDLLVEGCLLVEVKAVEGILPIHKAQLVSYLKLLDVPLGLLINFHELRLVDGVTRLFIPGSHQSELMTDD